MQEKNRNLCEQCIGGKRPEMGYRLSDTGRCGQCGEINEVWDLEYLAVLAAQGRAIYAPNGTTRIERPIRNSHTLHTLS